MRPVIFFLTVSILLHHAIALNILGIVSVPLRSHYMAFKPLFRELAVRGHSVTVINSFPDTQQTENLRFVDLKRDTNFNFTTLETFEDIHPSLLHIRNFYHFMTFSPDIVRHDCETLLTNVNAKEHLAEANEYDVIFVEMFTSDCALAYAAANYDAPIIGLTSHVLLPSTYTMLGLPFDLAADSFFFSNGGKNPPLYNKVESAIMKLCYALLDKLVFHRSIYEAFQKHMPNASLDIDFVAKHRLKMVFASQHYSMTGARLLSPQLLEIGGLHVSHPKPVPKDVEEFLSKAEHGAIYVSFGSNLKSSLMSQRMLHNFLTAFKNIPQKVLFKWENETFPTGHDNILTRKWFPQLDVLCHPKVVGFISHGGMLSSTEAVHCGKPMLTMPFFGDQFDNSASLREIGFAKTLFLANVTPDHLANIIKEITSLEMQQNAQRVSKMWHDRPLSPMDSAIYWTEYVARHNGAPPSLPSKRVYWFESLLLDVISIVFLILFLLVWLSLSIISLLKKILCSILKKLFCRNKEKRA